MTLTVVFLSLCGFAIAVLIVACKNYDKWRDAERQLRSLKYDVLTGEYVGISLDTEQLLNQVYQSGWNSAFNAMKKKCDDRVRDHT